MLTHAFHAWYGSVRITSDPNEQIFDMAFRFAKDPNQRSVDHEVSIGVGLFNGGFKRLTQSA